MRYRSTKTYSHDVGLSCSFRQWRADSHCRYVHGYALAVRLEFEAKELDARGWVVDFGSLKPVKAWLCDLFDHTTLVAEDDPERGWYEEGAHRGTMRVRIVRAVGCEAFAALIFSYVERWVLDTGLAPRVRLAAVEVREHGANSAIALGSTC